LAAARIDFTARGMMDGSLLPSPPLPSRGSPSPPPDPDDDSVDNGAIDGPTVVGEVKLAKTYGTQHPLYISISLICALVRRVPAMCTNWLCTWSSHASTS
jgi:hypothetical protein